ncbi:uncharacterized protein F4817DRAFT_254428 [Daldinia loculata]|uniref:uncharacterized protein n=1 Tax=Daldinia loculata TaxID=103429 RepID=UPI0020C2B00F|nr:uncharacterized protein F4817DRAFT_254428 [Daldinia loculata]KAI1643402.1 hypothetical protein F4817DRAFT_254428 [Daldinia loculata]
MAIHHGRVACKATPSRSVAVVVASYGSDGQLRTTIISGISQQRSLDLDVPDEGVYIIYQDRAIQIAAPPCDKRKCNASHICRCDTPQFSVKGSLFSRHSIKRRVVAWPVWKPCLCCLLNWLRLYQAAEAVNRHNLQFLRHPRTLTWTSLYGHQAFHYDAELEERSVRSNYNGTSNRPTNPKSYCPPRVFEWMKETWSEFVDSGCCKPRSITTLSDNEDGTYNESVFTKEQDGSETDSDWDDLDMPCVPSSTSDNTSNEDYDLIDDLIEKEFPMLRKSDTTISTKGDLPYSSKKDNGPDEERDDPAPVVIPPKNMTMARGFVAATGLGKPSPAQLGNDSSVSIIDSKCTKPQTGALGTKRSYSTIVESDQRSPTPAEDLSRIKQRKREIAKPSIRSRHRYSPVIHQSFPHLKRIPQRILVT